MSKECSKGSSEAEKLSKLLKGKKLFQELIKDKSLFLNLGYTEYQSGLANRALSNINSREGSLVNIGNKFMLEITSDDDAQVAVIDLLRHGGYYLTAYYYYRAEDLLKAATFEEDLAIYRSKRPTQPIFSDDDDCVARLRVLPKDFADMPKDRLVKALYEGTENAYHQLVAMHEWDDYIGLASFELSSVAIFKAAWRDQITKQDLVVSTNYDDKGDMLKEPRVNMVVWRRLSGISFKGKLWTPFGRIPSKLTDYFRQ